MNKLGRTAVYFAAFTALGMVAASLGPTLPGLAAQTGADLGAISFLFTTRSFGFLLGTLLVGRLLNRIPGHHVIAAAVLLMVLFMALVPLTPLLWLLTIILFLLGVAETGIDIPSNTLIVWLHGAAVSPFMNALHFFFGLGAFLAPLIIARVLAAGGGVAWSYWLLALLVFPVALIFLRLPSPADTQKETAERRLPRQWGLISLLALLLFLYTGAEIAFGGWIYTYALNREIATATTAAYLNSAFWGALTVGRLLSVPLAARLAPRKLLGLSLGGCLLSVGLMVAAPTAVLIWTGTVGLGLSMSAIFPTTLSFAERQMPIDGPTTSYLFVGAGLGSMTIPWLTGQLLNDIGPQAIMPTMFVALLLATAVFLVLLFQGRKKQPLTQEMI